MEAVTITQISPGELAALIESTLQKTLAAQQAKEPTEEADRWMDITELSKYLPDHPAVPTIYGYIHRRTIPFHKRSKKLYFLKSEIDAWLRSGKQLTHSEAKAEASRFLKRRS